MITNRVDQGPPTAVVCIDDGHATVCRSEAGDRQSVVEIGRGTDPESLFLAHVVHELDEGERVMIVGSSRVRLALEREFVSISHRPDRLVAATPSVRAGGLAIVDRVGGLAA